MDGGLNKLGITLTVVFAVCLIALLAELSYVFWRWHQQSNTGGDPHDSGFHFYMRTKELLCYFLCWRNQSRIEPNETPPPIYHAWEVDEALKWQGLYGPSRMLFTIREEEDREGIESERCSFSEKEIPKTMSVQLEECEITVTIEVDYETTPFETPSASPPYYTPLPSPTRLSENDRRGQNASSEYDVHADKNV